MAFALTFVVVVVVVVVVVFFNPNICDSYMRTFQMVAGRFDSSRFDTSLFGSFTSLALKNEEYSPKMFPCSFELYLK